MNNKCKCGSYAINQTMHGRSIGTDPDLCDVCYWRKRAIDKAEDNNRLTERIQQFDALINEIAKIVGLESGYAGVDTDDKSLIEAVRLVVNQRDYHCQRADANWRALCECRGE